MIPFIRKVWFISLLGFSLKKNFHIGKPKFSTQPCKTLNPEFSFLLKHPTLFGFNSVINSWEH